MHPTRWFLALGTSAAALYIYSSAITSVLERDPNSLISRSYGGHFQYLTILSVATSLLHQVFSVVSLLTGLRVFNFVQNAIAMVSAPLEVVVLLIYWPLKLTHPGLLKDKNIAFEISNELDRRLHLYPAIFEVLSTTVFAQRAWRHGLACPLLLFALVGNGYWAWVELTYKHNYFYPYPLLSVLDFKQKTMLISSAVVMALIAFKIIQALQRKNI